MEMHHVQGVWQPDIQAKTGTSRHASERVHRNLMHREWRQAGASTGKNDRLVAKFLKPTGQPDDHAFRSTVLPDRQRTVEVESDPHVDPSEVCADAG